MQMVLHVTRILTSGNNAPSSCLDSPKLWNAILAKSPDHIMNSPDILWKVEILLWTIQIYYERSWFYYEQSRYIMKGQNFIMNSPDMLWKVEISLGRIQVSYEKPRLYYISLFQRQPFKIGVLRNFSIFTGKHLCWILKSVKKKLQYRYYPMNIATFLRTPFLRSNSEGEEVRKLSILLFLLQSVVLFSPEEG